LDKQEERNKALEQWKQKLDHKEHELAANMREVEAIRRELDDQRVCIEIREKEVRKMEKKAEREVDKARKAL